MSLGAIAGGGGNCPRGFARGELSGGRGSCLGRNCPRLTVDITLNTLSGEEISRLFSIESGLQTKDFSFRIVKESIINVLHKG